MAGSAKIYISHAREDAARCAALLKWLDAWGVEYWFEARTDDIGQLTQNTQTALAECAVFLRICTPPANRSYWMSLELGAFLSLQAEEQRRGVQSSRSLVSLILDPAYQRQPFDHSGAIVDATDKPQTAWLADLRAAFGMPPLTESLASAPQGPQVEIPVTTVTMTRRRAIGVGVAATAALAVAGSTGLLLLERKHAPSPGPITAAATATATPQPKPAFVDSNLAWYYKTGDKIASIPAVANNMVYFSSDDQNIYALDAKTGKKVWIEPVNLQFEGSTVLGQSHVFFETKNTIAGFDYKTGQLTWQHGLVVRTPATGDGLVYAGNLGEVDALPESDDQIGIVWYGDTSASGSQQDSAVISVTYSNKVVYAGTQHGELYAFDASNANPQQQANSGAPTAKARLLWVYKTGGAINQHATVANGVVYLGSDDHYLHAIDAKSGQRKWAFKAGDAVDSSVLVSNGMVYFAANNNIFYAVDANKGTKVWTFKPDGNVAVASGALDSSSGKIYVSSASPYLYVLDPATRQKVHQYQTGGTIATRATVANGIVYVGGQDHYLYAFHTV